MVGIQIDSYRIHVTDTGDCRDKGASSSELVYWINGTVIGVTTLEYVHVAFGVNLDTGECRTSFPLIELPRTRLGC